MSRLPTPVLTGSGSRVCGASRTLSAEALPCRCDTHYTLGSAPAGQLTSLAFSGT